ncbi:MAG: hypothetical protein M3O30_16190 [Planctomycetota bacterium]|nr:hypothetical protein [Planctomycetota bacterium]
MLPKVVDVTAITGELVVGPLTSWKTPNGPDIVEHLAGKSPSGDLLVFWWSSEHDWQSVNVSQITGQEIVGGLTSWQTKNGPFLVEHLAAVNANGDMLVFWWSPQHDWQVVDVSAKTGVKVVGDITSWQTPNGPFNVEHLAAVTSAGDLMVFWWSPQQDWQAVNVSQITGQKIRSSVTSWQTPNGPDLVEHLAGMSTNGDLLVFWWSSQHNWQAVNVSQITGQKIAAQPTSWQTVNGQYNVEHLAAMSPTGDLIVFWWSPQHDWQAINVTQRTAGPKITGVPTSWQTKQGAYLYEYVACESPDNSLVIFWWSPRYDWQAINTTSVIRYKIASSLTSWQTPSNPDIIDHLAASDPQNRLLVFWHSTKSDSPWVVLLCKFQDDNSTPITLDLARREFTSVAAGTFNMLHFFYDVSHGSIDMSKTQAFDWLVVDVNVSDLVQPNPAPPGWTPKYSRNDVTAKAKKKALDAGIQLSDFVGAVVVFNVAVGGAQGGSWAGGVPNVGVFSDFRYVINNGSQSFGQEMGHAYGLDHSRADNLADAPFKNTCSDPAKYGDGWDGMSTACAFSIADNDYGSRGPGFNAWNMRGRSWLNESRVWVSPAGAFNQTVQLRPLYRLDLPGFLAAELPGIAGTSKFLVEFRPQSEWDGGIPRSAVLVHRFEGNIGQFLGSHSFIMSSITHNQDIVANDEFDVGQSLKVKVVNIDEQNSVATIQLIYNP